MAETKFRIAISGATSPKGKALKEALPRSRFRDVDVRLIDEEELQGTLTEYHGGVELIRQMTVESFTNVDLVFLCEDASKSAAHLKLLHEHFGDAAPTIVDLSGDHSLAVQPERRTSTLPREATTDRSPAFLPHPLALGIAQIFDLCSAFGEITRAFATALVPVSDRGKGGIEALHEQLVEIMNFGDTPKDMFGQQLIFNVLPAMGDINSEGTTDIESDIVEQVRNLLGKKDLPFQLIMNQVPVFYSYAISLLISFDKPVETNRIRLAFENAEGFSLGTPPAQSGPLETTDSSDYRLARLVGMPGDTHSVALWLTFDNVTTGAVNQAILIAEELFEEDSRLAGS
jgi:aspartate-semialdehyde dehydrogenase